MPTSQLRHEDQWSPRRLVYKGIFFIRRSLKRRMKGESRRQWIERNLQNSFMGVAVDIAQSVFMYDLQILATAVLVLTLLCKRSILMMYAIFKQNQLGASTDTSRTYKAIDVLNLVSIGVSYFLRFYAAGNRLGFCLHWLSLADMCSGIPLMLDILTQFSAEISSTLVFRLLRMARSLRVLQFYRLLRLAPTAKSRQGCLISLTVMCIIFCAAAAYQTIEYCDPLDTSQVSGKNCQNLSFSNAMYFVCITIGTVGYGDVAPKSRMGRVMDIILIISTYILIPLQISGYTDILNRETVFDKKYIPDKSIQHVLLCGDIDNGALRFFLHSWLHKEGDRGSRRKVIILAPTLPSTSMRRLLISRKYEQHVLYLQGSAMVTADLQRAAAPTAAFCFIMVKKHTNAQDQNDTAANLLTCSVRKNNLFAPLLVQVSKYDNVRHVNISGASAVICLEQLKISIAAKSLWIRGLSTLLGNLVQPFDITEESRGFWLSEYLHGCSQSMFEAVIPTFLLAMPTFASLALLIYREFGVPIVALRTVDEAIVVFPVDKDTTDVSFQSIFFIGKFKDTALKIEKLGMSVFARHTDIAPSLDIPLTKTSRTVSGMLSAAIEGKLPFRNTSVIIADDPGLYSTARTNSIGHALNPVANLIQGVQSVLVAQNPNNMTDKITPVGDHELYGDSKSFTEDKKIFPRRMNLSDGAYDKMPCLSPLTSAELVKKVNSPAPSPRIYSVIRTPRTSRMSREPSVHFMSAKETVPLRVPSETIEPDAPLSAKKSAREVLSDVLERAKSPETSSTADGETNRHVLIKRHSSSADRDLLNEMQGAASVPVLRRGSSSVAARSKQSRLRGSSKFRSFQRRGPPADLSSHYVVCGTPTNYTDFLINLKDLDEMLGAVVFVTPRELNEKDFQAYMLHRQLYFVRGSPVTMQVFNDARMLYARSILIMSYCGGESHESDTTEMESMDENMADVDAITTHRFISEACQAVGPKKNHSIVVSRSHVPYIVAEMIRPSNVKFLIDRSGSLYDETALENNFRRSELLKDAKSLDDCLFSPLYTAGHIFFTNFSDSLMGACSQHIFLIEVITKLLISGNMSMNLPDHDARSRHRLSQIPAPIRFHHRPYGLLVEGLLQDEKLMALGVYRFGNSHISPTFVFTNPAADDLVAPHDLVFVIK